MSEEREYSIITNLSKDKDALQEGELFLRMPNWKVFNRLLIGWLDKDLEANIKPMRYKRSLAQNRYMHGVIVPIVRNWIKETTGEKRTKEEVYAHLNTNVLGNQLTVTEICGQEVIVISGKRFSQYNTKEFSDAVEKIVQYFDEKGLTIPLPNENNLLDDHIKNNN